MIENQRIDYSKIASANKYYVDAGYQLIDVPWFVSLESINSTFNVKKPKLFETFAGNLVASGEQSFVEIRKELSFGKYQCTTPCFRAEKELNELKQMYFMKTELIHVFEPNDPNRISFFNDMVMDAMLFFAKYGRPKIITTDIGVDINLNDIEVGSYGFRSYDDFHWVYGTGCAEPRLSYAMKAK